MKPVVTYGTFHGIVIGNCACLTEIQGHPKQTTGELKGDVIYTSTILSHNEETGTIETLNTIYQKRMG